LSQFRLIAEKQWLHAVLLAALLVPVVVVSRTDVCRVGRLWGLGTPLWFWLAVAVPIAHQVYVWFCWRTQLHASLLTRTLGTAGFTLYAIGFASFGIGRIVSVFLLGIANRDTLPINLTVLRALAVLAAIPAAYLFYSVARYFGFRRAMGIDHFDPAYRTEPFVRQGIFRFTKNGMYVYGFLMLWFPSLWWGSAAGLVIAAFNHAYIWVHYHATELPDIRHIYGPAHGDF
jgi:Phospholipid methyltransferase